MISSSYGDYCYQWNACGCTFPDFLRSISFGYFMGKTRGRELDEFDYEATVNGLKRNIIERRRSYERMSWHEDGNLKKDEAREMWDALVGIDSNDHCDQNMWLRSLMEVNDDNRFGEEPWYHIKTRPDPQAVYFWKEIWPVFIAELEKDFPRQPKTPKAAA